jgi:DNA modification methylase
MVEDLALLQSQQVVPSRVFQCDSRSPNGSILPGSINAVITSPPYPNEKDYTRTTRLESVILGFFRTKAQLRELKGGLVRSNTRTVYKKDDDDSFISAFPRIQRIAEEIEARRIALGKTSGFERLYGRVTKLYFGGMARHLAALRPLLRPGAKLAYVVGDQASFLRVMIRTGEILAEIAETLGYKVRAIDLFRTRLATATKERLREEVVVLEWPGGNL